MKKLVFLQSIKLQLYLLLYKPLIISNASIRPQDSESKSTSALDHGAHASCKQESTAAQSKLDYIKKAAVFRTAHTCSPVFNKVVPDDNVNITWPMAGWCCRVPCTSYALCPYFSQVAATLLFAVWNDGRCWIEKSHHERYCYFCHVSCNALIIIGYILSHFYYP